MKNSGGFGAVGDADRVLDFLRREAEVVGDLIDRVSSKEAADHVFHAGVAAQNDWPSVRSSDVHDHVSYGESG